MALRMLDIKGGAMTNGDAEILAMAARGRTDKKLIR